jgi:hypothetical protein
MTESNQEFRSALGDVFDQQMRAIRGLPDTTEVKPAPVTVLSPFVELVQNFIVQTMRLKERGDFVFLTYVDKNGSTRIVLPPEVCRLIARQADALSSKNRKRAAKEEAQRRKAAGIQPGFLKFKKGRKKA